MTKVLGADCQIPPLFFQMCRTQPFTPPDRTNIPGIKFNCTTTLELKFDHKSVALVALLINLGSAFLNHRLSPETHPRNAYSPSSMLFRFAMVGSLLRDSHHETFERSCFPVDFAVVDDCSLAVFTCCAMTPVGVVKKTRRTARWPRG